MYVVQPGAELEREIYIGDHLYDCWEGVVWEEKEGAVGKGENPNPVWAWVSTPIPWGMVAWMGHGCSGSQPS